MTSQWINFDIHGVVGVRVRADAPTATQLRTMLGSFLVEYDVPPDLIVEGTLEPLFDASHLEDELRYTQDTVEFVRHHVQVQRRGPDRFTVRGTGELLTSVIPLVDMIAVLRGTAMIHAATVGYLAGAVALPAAGGTGKTSSIAKLMRRPGFSFMGDDWGFVTEDSRLLNYEKPMFIKPHHRPIFPHLFTGARKPMVPQNLSRSMGRVATAAHPHIAKYPRLADFTRRWSPEHRIVSVDEALPGVPVTRAAPLYAAIFVERYDGARTVLEPREVDWLVERMVGNFHIEMPGFSRDLMTGMAASSQLSLGAFFDLKEQVLAKALASVPTYVLRVPSAFGPDTASDDIVRFLEATLGRLMEQE